MTKETTAGPRRTITRRKTLRLLGAGASGLALAPAALRAACAGRRDADVIVIGAGLSGLQAAVILQDEGMDVLVVEGSKRIGGRVWSLDHVPGKPEAGGAEIGPGYARMHSMIARLGGLRLSSWLKYHGEGGFAIYDGGELYSLGSWPRSPANRFDEAERRRFGPSGPFGVAMSYMPVPSPLPGLESWLDPEFAALDLPLTQYLREKGASEEALRYAATSVPADSLQETSALYLLRSLRFMQEMGPLDGLRVFDDGTSRVPEGMAALLRREVRTRAPVAGLRSLDDCAEALLADGSVLRAERIVCTVPLPVLRELKFEPALPPLQAQAVQSIPYGSALSVFFAIKEPFWEHDGLAPSTWSCSEFGKAFVRRSPRGQHLWFHKSGVAGVPLKHQPDAQIMRIATAELHQARPSTQGRIEATAVVNWSASPWTRGHLAHRGPGQIKAFGHVIAQPHGRIHFAGEHTAVTMMGMEGAMESGERAAVEVLSALS